MHQNRSIGIGILGLGVIGSQVAQALFDNNRIERLSLQVGSPMILSQVADTDVEKLQSSGLPDHLLTTNAMDVLNNPKVDIIVELIGGIKPSIDFISTAISQGNMW